jgi:hypothetical protein
MGGAGSDQPAGNSAEDPGRGGTVHSVEDERERDVEGSRKETCEDRKEYAALGRGERAHDRFP